MINCPGCEVALSGEPPPPAAPAEAGEEDSPPRFVSLSALPPEKRMPPRTDGPRKGLFVPRRLDQLSGVVAARRILPTEPVPAAESATAQAIPLTLESPVAHPGPQPVHPPVPLPEFPRLGFNCPACFTILYIKDPAGYDGRPAPCPYCRVAILPPRLVPPSPFILIADGDTQLPPVPKTSRFKPFRVHDFIAAEAQAVAEDDAG